MEMKEEMKEKAIIMALVMQAGGRIFHVSPEIANISATNIKDDIWEISFEGVAVTGKIYACPNSQIKVVFEVTKAEGQRKLADLKKTTIAKTEDILDIVEAVVMKAGEQIFHVSPATLYVKNTEDGVWVIFFEGVAVTGEIHVNDKEATFEAIKIEGKRKLAGLKFTI